MSPSITISRKAVVSLGEMRATIKVDAVPHYLYTDGPRYFYLLYNVTQKIDKPILVVLGTLTTLHHK